MERVEQPKYAANENVEQIVTAYKPDGSSAIKTSVDEKSMIQGINKKITSLPIHIQKVLSIQQMW